MKNETEKQIKFCFHFFLHHWDLCDSVKNKYFDESGGRKTILHCCDNQNAEPHNQLEGHMMLRFDEMVLNGIAGQLGIIAQTEFFQQAKTIGIHRFNADIVDICNFAIGFADGQVPQYL